MLKRISVLMLGLVLFASPALAAQNVLRWADNADNEANTRIERAVVPDLASCLPTGTGFAEISQTGANVTTFTDLTPSEGVTYCYRVRAWNTSGFSLYSNAAGRTVPFPLPVLVSISPTTATAGGPAFTLTVTGSDLRANSVVNVNGAPRATTFVSATQLTAALLASDITIAGSLNVTVVTPAPGGGTSGVAVLAIPLAVPLAPSNLVVQ